jgi:Uma2 family endonuclease
MTTKASPAGAQTETSDAAEEAARAPVVSPDIDHIEAEDDTPDYEIPEINIDHIETEDDTPVDNLASAKQQRLLVEPLYSSHPLGERIFLADANVGLFSILYHPPLVPDMFLSLDVQPHQDWWAKQHRSYFFWEFGKPPELVVEIVSNRKGGEDIDKVREYARMRVLYYVIYDPNRQLSDRVLRAYRLDGVVYVEMAEPWFAELGMGLKLWNGRYEDVEHEWLRWCDREGNLVPTGAELAAEAKGRAVEAEGRAAEAEHRAAEAERRAQTEAQARTEAEERIRLLEEQLRRLREGADV